MNEHHIMIRVGDARGAGPYVVSESLRNRILVLVMEGLHTDGAHHKQYILERVLASFYDDDALDAIRKEEPWTPGIAP